ncbi:MAG: endolytic transglycosylase MltG [Balneola sp.]|nr:MAG: endolytic transglycosylase MltG [Balneola sp.]
MNFSATFSLQKNDLLVTISFFLIVVLATIASRQLRLTSENALLFEDTTYLKVDQRTNLEGLIESLDSLNVDYDQQELRWASRILGWRTFQRGNYEINGYYSYEVFLSKLSRGIQDPVPVVILPGITKERFALSVSNQVSINEEDMLDIFQDSLFLDELGLTTEELFGRMLPETYRIYWTSTPKELVRRVLREFESTVIDVYSDSTDALGYSIQDVLTMASIVEWEANLEEEKAVISGLYWNRLNQRMRLQADPTVNFAIGERRRLLFEDYEFEHPFNTYLNRGLPPGPVTNPSLSTIKATLFPEEHNYIYMVANPEGGHIFTETFEEHQVESAKWRRWLREQYRIKRARDAENSSSER